MLTEILLVIKLRQEIRTDLTLRGVRVSGRWVCVEVILAKMFAQTTA